MFERFGLDVLCRLVACYLYPPLKLNTFLDYSKVQLVENTYDFKVDTHFSLEVS